MSDALLTPENNVWFAKKGQSGIRSLDSFRRAHQLTIKVIGDKADRKAKAVLIAFNVEGLAYVIDDPAQLLGVIRKLDEAHRMLTGRGEAKVISFGDGQGAEDYLYQTRANQG